jgi:hypothetical protein
MAVGRQKKMKATTRWLWVGKKRKKVDFSNRSNKNEHKLNGNPKKRPKKKGNDPPIGKLARAARDHSCMTSF